MSGDSHAYVVFQSLNQDSAESVKVIVSKNVANVTPVSKGIYEVAFEKNVFSNFPAVTVTQLCAGANTSAGSGALYPVTTTQGNNDADPCDNALITRIIQQTDGTYACTVKTSDSSGNALYRSFSLIAFGPGQGN